MVKVLEHIKTHKYSNYFSLLVLDEPHDLDKPDYDKIKQIFRPFLQRNGEIDYDGYIEGCFAVRSRIPLIDSELFSEVQASLRCRYKYVLSPTLHFRIPSQHKSNLITFEGNVMAWSDMWEKEYLKTSDERKPRVFNLFPEKSTVSLTDYSPYGDTEELEYQIILNKLCEDIPISLQLIRFITKPSFSIKKANIAKIEELDHPNIEIIQSNNEASSIILESNGEIYISSLLHNWETYDHKWGIDAHIFNPTPERIMDFSQKVEKLYFFLRDPEVIKTCCESARKIYQIRHLDDILNSFDETQNRAKQSVQYARDTLLMEADQILNELTVPEEIKGFLTLVEARDIPLVKLLE